jgi:hypothetical protein
MGAEFRAAMRRALVLGFLFLPLFLFAADRKWQDATFVSIESSSSDNGVAVIPSGTMMLGVPLRAVRNYYRLDTADVSYLLVTVNKKPLNLTLHGKTKLAVDGMKAWVMDDSGKEVKVPILQKVAKQ